MIGCVYNQNPFAVDCLVDERILLFVVPTTLPGSMAKVLNCSNDLTRTDCLRQRYFLYLYPLPLKVRSCSAISTLDAQS